MLNLRSRSATVAAFVSAAGCMSLVASLSASTPKFFQAATQADFLKGDVENLSIDVNGRLMLGPATELVYETAAPFLWAAVPGPDGTLFVGTGNEGKVFKIDAQGKGSLFFDTTELEAHALAPAPDGGLFVGTSPDGKIYKVDRSGNGTVFFDSGDKYIWSLAVDANGNLYAGTGEKGIVYKIAPDGKGAPFYATRTTHATALAFDKSGNLLVATGSPGRVLRVDSTGKAFMLLDSPFQEVRALRFDDNGALYVAAQSGRATTGGAVTTDAGADRPVTETSSQPVASVSVEVTSMSIVDSGSSASTGSTREDRRPAKGAVYRIMPDGLWDELWDSRDDVPYDLTFDDKGALLIGTGGSGKIFRLEGEPLRPTLLARAGAQQVTAFLKDARGRMLYTTANPGKVFRLTTERAANGTYESEPQDAQMVATWGAVTWHGDAAGGRLELFTRSGNSETPDDTWSAWAPVSSSNSSAIASPKARYLQWRAVLTGKDGSSPVLTSVTAAYLQRNLRPQVQSITVHPPGIVFQKPFSTGEPELAGFDNQTTPERTLTNAAMNTQSASSGGSPALGRRTFQKGLQTVAWRAEDTNGDDLNFDVLYRREGETVWKPLRRNVTEPILVWDTNTIRNGTYFIRVVASDSGSNPVDTALTGELDSSAFDVDNTGAAITLGPVRTERGRTIASFDVKDDYSAVQRVEFSQDGQQWRAVFPVDGISDSKSEHYELSLDGELTEQGLTLRATDAMNNTSTAHVDAPAKR
jgi:sugar lactone lactonase YvrE